jgi:hypothetical protein
MACAFLALVASACAGSPNASLVPFGEEPGASIPQLDNCDDFGTNPLDLEPDEPINLLVHGCAASSARLNTLAAEFEAAGQQAVCFSYDERNRLEASSVQLQSVLRILERHQRSDEITILAHSMGGLVARHALVHLEGDSPMRFRLVAVSSPFMGIRSSRHCGNTALHVLTLGITVGVCQAVTGSKWTEIHPGSEFTSQPGRLPDHVVEHLQVVTDEVGSCRRWSESGECEQDDFVFTIAEQTNRSVDSDPRVRRVVAKVGHAEVIGVAGRRPDVLAGILREHGILSSRSETAALASRAATSR